MARTRWACPAPHYRVLSTVERACPPKWPCGSKRPLAAQLVSGFACNLTMTWRRYEREGRKFTRADSVPLRSLCCEAERIDRENNLGSQIGNDSEGLRADDKVARVRLWPCLNADAEAPNDRRIPH